MRYWPKGALGRLHGVGEIRGARPSKTHTDTRKYERHSTGNSVLLTPHPTILAYPRRREANLARALEQTRLIPV